MIVADGLRVLALAGFGYSAMLDARERRVPVWVWPPLLALGVLALGVEAVVGESTPARLGVALVVLVPLGFGGFAAGALGGADAKALIALAVVFPTEALDALTLAVLLVVGIVAVLGVTNVLAGRGGLAALFGFPVDADDVDDRHGALLDVDGRLPREGLDLDALRLYLEWREVSLAGLRASHDDLRGGILADQWRAYEFVEDVDGDAFGTTPETLREGLDRVATSDRVWITPGLPFLVPLFWGIVLALAL